MATTTDIEMIRASFATQKEFMTRAGEAVPTLVNGLVKMVEDLLQEIAEQAAEIERLKAESD